MTRHHVTLFGVGGWGERLAGKLVARGDVDVVLVDERAMHVRRVAKRLGVRYSSSPVRYLSEHGTSSSTGMRGSVIVATPPDARVELVRMILQADGAVPARLRVEKPLAIEPRDAHEIVGLCNAHDVKLSVGFTLLHHWQYDHAFEYIERSGRSVVRVVGTRIGKPARHRASAAVDLGSHTASIAAYLGASCTMRAGYSQEVTARTTQLVLDTGDSIIIDEVDGTTKLPSGRYANADRSDALDTDLGAWLSDSHRGDARVGLGAMFMVWDELNRRVVAA